MTNRFWLDDPNLYSNTSQQHDVVLTCLDLDVQTKGKSQGRDAMLSWIYKHCHNLKHSYEWRQILTKTLSKHTIDTFQECVKICKNVLEPESKTRTQQDEFRKILTHAIQAKLNQKVWLEKTDHPLLDVLEDLDMMNVVAENLHERFNNKTKIASCSPCVQERIWTWSISNMSRKDLSSMLGEGLNCMDLPEQYRNHEDNHAQARMLSLLFEHAPKNIGWNQLCKHRKDETKCENILMAALIAGVPLSKINEASTTRQIEPPISQHTRMAMFKLSKDMPKPLRDALVCGWLLAEPKKKRRVRAAEPFDRKTYKALVKIIGQEPPFQVVSPRK